jgi:hypothetical protein
MAGELFVLSFENLKAWCVRQSYQFSENAQLQQLAIHYQLLGQPAPLMVIPQLDRGMLMFVMAQPFKVPEERRLDVMRAAALLNAQTFMGAWVINTQTGELFFRVTIPALDTQYSDQVVLHVARVAVGTSEKVAPALKAIALDGADPVSSLQAALG